MAAEMENEAVEETDLITDDKGCSTSDIIERKKKSVIIWSVLLFIRKTSHMTYNEKVGATEEFQHN